MAEAVPLPSVWATGHQKTTVRQPSPQVSIDNGIDLAADTAGDLDAGADEGPFKRIGKGPAYQHVHSKGGDLSHPPERVAAGKRYALTTYLPSVFDVDQAQGPRYIENGRNASLPMGNRDSHKFYYGNLHAKPPHNKIQRNIR